MAKRPEPQRVDSRPSVPDMVVGLRKIARRKTELQALDPNSIQQEEDERKFEAWPPMWNDTVAEIFGRNSIQFAEYKNHGLKQHESITMAFEYRGYDVSQARNAFSRGKAEALQRIETIERIFAERLEDAGERPAARAAATFQGLPIHEALVRAIGDRFQNAHYEDAVLRAYIALEELVKGKANRQNLSGTSLMEQVFSLNAPLLQVADLNDPSGRDEQMGSMRLFSGAALAVRNPRAHTLKADTAEKALEQIVFLSHLAKTVDAAARTANP
jgi:uncharacterized protein (TIGR02391 family)